MKRALKQVNGPDGRVKYQVTLMSNACEKTGTENRAYLFDFLQQIANTPYLLDCGTKTMESGKIWHNGEAWVMVVEATE